MFSEHHWVKFDFKTFIIVKFQSINRVMGLEQPRFLLSNSCTEDNSHEMIWKKIVRLKRNLVCFLIQCEFVFQVFASSNMKTLCVVLLVVMIVAVTSRVPGRAVPTRHRKREWRSMFCFFLWKRGVPGLLEFNLFLRKQAWFINKLLSMLHPVRKGWWTLLQCKSSSPHSPPPPLSLSLSLSLSVSLSSPLCLLSFTPLSSLSPCLYLNENQRRIKNSTSNWRPTQGVIY